MENRWPGFIPSADWPGSDSDDLYAGKKQSTKQTTEENETDVRKSVDNYWKHAYNYITIENLYAMLLNNGDPEGYSLKAFN